MAKINARLGELRNPPRFVPLLRTDEQSNGERSALAGLCGIIAWLESSRALALGAGRAVGSVGSTLPWAGHFTASARAFCAGLPSALGLP